MPFVASIGLLLTKMFTLGIVVAGPLMIVMTAIDIALVFATRVAKQIQVSEFANYFKNLAAAMAIPIYAVFLDQYIRDEWRILMKFIHDFLRLESGG
jgi:type III secretory pathway component EscT